jgi:hypothetical protein
MIVDNIDYTPAHPQRFRKSPSGLECVRRFATWATFQKLLKRQFLQEERPTMVCASMRQMIITLLREVTLLIPDSDATNSSRDHFGYSKVTERNQRNRVD